MIPLPRFSYIYWLFTSKNNELPDTLIMVFSEADKAIIKHYHEKRYTTHKIWRDNREKH